ncbi:MAG: AMP-binding protein, partial [Defluviitaleaceae bacterium]|nr:AMP-binding protein [Defluviitaleaceae bacterium]
MQKNILEYLENIVVEFSEKLAFSDGMNEELTFGGLISAARSAGSFLAERFDPTSMVAIFMERAPATVSAFFACMYAGRVYVPLDDEMPVERIQNIISQVQPGVMIVSKKTAEKAAKLDFSGEIVVFDGIVNYKQNDIILGRIRKNQADSDPVYIVFTSGSTGVPKGVVASHRAVIGYIEGLSQVLGVTNETIFGSQSPLYLDACLKELICTIKHGASAYFIPKPLFSFPVKLVEYINIHNINTVCWVSSVFTIVSSLGVLDKYVPHSLHTIAFGSEVLPRKHFNAWRSALPEARFINLYGPTEATGMSCYCEIGEVDITDDEPIPIGRAFPNTKVFIIPDEDGLGEIYIGGSRLALGYFNDFEKTNAAFIQNPLHSNYPDIV